jgi:regulator of protease activity HflC (stomatin/prohibitin superfamily)
MRNVLGTKNLSQILSDREIIARDMLEILDLATDPWGIKVLTINKINVYMHTNFVFKLF